MRSRPLPESGKAFAHYCRKQFFNIALLEREGQHELGQFPSKQELFEHYLGTSGIDVSETMDWIYNVLNIRRRAGIDIFPFVKDGFTDVFVAGDRTQNLSIARATLAGDLRPPPSFEYLALERIVPIAVSYKHGMDEQLCLQRLMDAICALDFFLEPGKRFVLWIDKVATTRTRRFNPTQQSASWLKRGLLPYQIFVVLCLDNLASGHTSNDYRNSFWLNIEGVLANIGSGMIMVGRQLKKNAVSSWLFDDKRAHIPIEFVVEEPDWQVAYRPGNLMECSEAIQILLQIAIKGGFDESIARHNEDKEDLISMANCVIHCKSWTDFGKVVYDPQFSSYDRLFEMLSADTHPDNFSVALFRSGRTFCCAAPGYDTMYPTLIEAKPAPKLAWISANEWLPKHCQFFRSMERNPAIQEIWFHFERGERVVAAIGIAVAAKFPDDMSYDSRLHVKVLEINQIGGTFLRFLMVTRVIGVWDSRIPGLIQELLRVLEGKDMDLQGISEFLKGSGVDCEQIGSFFVSNSFETIGSDLTIPFVADLLPKLFEYVSWGLVSLSTGFGNRRSSSAEVTEHNRPVRNAAQLEDILNSLTSLSNSLSSLSKAPRHTNWLTGKEGVNSNQIWSLIQNLEAVSQDEAESNNSAKAKHRVIRRELSGRTIMSFQKEFNRFHDVQEWREKELLKGLIKLLSQGAGRHGSGSPSEEFNRKRVCATGGLYSKESSISQDSWSAVIKKQQ